MGFFASRQRLVILLAEESIVRRIVTMVYN